MPDMESRARELWEDIKNEYSEEADIPFILRHLTEAYREGMEAEYRRDINERGRAASDVLSGNGWRYCDIAACNCNSWHPPELEDTNEYKRGMEAAAKVAEGFYDGRKIAAAIREKINEEVS